MPDFSQEFIKSKGQPIIYKDKTVKLADVLNINKTQKIKLIIEKIGSKYRQGIALKINEGSVIHQTEEYKKKSKNGIVFAQWADEEPEYEVILKNTDRMLRIWNYWAQETVTGTIRASWTKGAAMIVEELPNGRRYHCNDWEPDEDFDDLIFRIELID